MEYMEVRTDRSRKITEISCVERQGLVDYLGILLFPIAINELGDRGWRLVFGVATIENNGYYFYFERAQKGY